ncbi:MAG: diguanylate cyclase [Leptolyngbya sp. BL-A-14]
MLLQLLNQVTAKTLRKLPLRTILVVPFAVQIFGTVALVGYLSFKNGQAAVTDLAKTLESEVAVRIQAKLSDFLESSYAVNTINAKAVQAELLQVDEPIVLGKHFWGQLQAYPSIRFAFMGNPQGGYVGATHETDGTFSIDLTPKFVKGKIHTYATDQRGNLQKLVHVISKDYDSRSRSWYQSAVKTRQSGWNQILQSFDDPFMGLIAYQPLYDQKQRLLGVLGTEHDLAEISEFLSTFKVGHSRQIFIVEKSGLLIASSTTDPLFVKSKNSELFKRLQATESSNTIIRSTAYYLTQRFGSFAKIEQLKQLNFELDGKQQLLQVVPFQDVRGLDWFIVIVVPESDFMAQIDANTRMTILLCLAALGVSIALGTLTARWVIRPILHLNTTAKAIAAGNWHPLPLSKCVGELGELTHSFNQMANQLQTSFAEMQQLNQQLAESESRLTQFLEALPIGVAVHNPDGSVFYFNQMAKCLLGVASIPNRSIEQQSAVYQLYRAGTAQLYPLDELPAVRALRGENVITDDLELHRNGEVRFTEVLATPIKDGSGNVVYAIVAFQDITKRKQAEAALRASESRFRRLTENVPGVIYRYVYYANGCRGFTYLSPRFQELYELDPALVLTDPKHFWHMIPQEDLTAMRASSDRCFQELKPWSMEHRVLLPSGRLIWVQNVSCPEQQANGDVVYDGISIDVTDRKQAELLLSDYNRLLEQQVHTRTLALKQEISERQKAEDALKQANLELEHLATLDGLTQIANRHRFDGYLAQVWQYAVREQEPLSLIFCDVDFFKHFNDRYGHQAGDACLRQIAQVMKDAIKRPADLLARYGGEEFVVVLPKTDSAGAHTVATAIQTAVRRLKLPHAASEVSAYITISLGIATTIPQVDSSSDDLIAAADTALYRAKKEGRNRTVVYRL